jgi:uncharacterized membrane protein YdjX (TVP38/TMEM64 family)
MPTATSTGQEAGPVKKLALLLVILLVMAAAILLASGTGPGLEEARQHISDLQTWRSANPMLFSAIFFVGYVLVVALSLPFALWMTLATGALFGLFGGIAVASFASTIGATLAFLASRWIFRGWVLSRFGQKLKPLSEGLAKDGSAYLFTLRLIPVVPFFLVNLLMGLTSMSALRFYLVSQIGMLPATIVYVNAGTQLAQLTSVKGLLSAPLLLSFALLGLFPWLAKALVLALRRRQIYSKWSRPSRFDRNLIVIGGGAAGLVSAYIAAATKAKVTLIEANRMGGDCLNYGCVPSKALIRSAKLAHEFRQAAHFGLTPVAPTIDFQKVFERIDSVIAAIEPHDSAERYEGMGVEVLQGHARILDPWTVETAMSDGQEVRLTTRSIVIATGASPFVPDTSRSGGFWLPDVGYNVGKSFKARLRAGADCHPWWRSDRLRTFTKLCASWFQRDTCRNGVATPGKGRRGCCGVCPPDIAGGGSERPYGSSRSLVREGWRAEMARG